MSPSSNHESKKRKVLKKIASYSEIIQGSITKRMHTCGKPQCRCHTAKELRHCSYQLSFALQGKTKTITIPKDKLDEVKKGIQQYKNFRRCIIELLDINRTNIKRSNATVGQ